ncbi:MAG: hypothetical protein ABS78_17075 [Phenylobacterium sp. SCN 70-31]|nr:MAG: hypothetical protein ABS78_17075 [Phenylobacterium sp. SCN 70-31]
MPQDYKDFVRVYGSGYFMEFLGINVPRNQNTYTRFEADIHRVRGIFLEDEELPYTLWPEPGGLITFGGTDEGDHLFWLPRGAPEDWRVVVWSRGSSTFEVLDCDLTSFLAGLATGDLLPDAFPEDMLPCDHPFQPSPPRNA